VGAVACSRFDCSATSETICCSADASKLNRFITLGGEPYFIRCNSRLPIVVYVPEGVEVRYRIWTSGTDVKAIEKE